MVDAVGEGAAVARASPRVREQHDEIVRGKVLEHIVEAHVVHCEWTPVDLENQGVFPGDVKGGRLHDPRLNFRIPA